MHAYLFDLVHPSSSAKGMGTGRKINVPLVMDSIIRLTWRRGLQDKVQDLLLHQHSNFNPHNLAVMSMRTNPVQKSPKAKPSSGLADTQWLIIIHDTRSDQITDDQEKKKKKRNGLYRSSRHPP